MANIPVAPFYVPRPADDQLWSPNSTPSPFLRFATQQKMFGQGGQVPAKNWNATNTYDDASVWNIPPKASAIIPLSTFQIFFGKGGQAPEKRWNVVYTFDDPSVWSGNPVSSETLHPLLTAGGQVRSRQWLFGFDDPAYWVGSPIDAAPIPMLTVGGKPRTKQWHYDIDDPASWSFTIHRDMPLLAAQPSPIIAQQSSFDIDDPAPWQLQQQRDLPLNAVPAVYIVRAPIYAAKSDDSASWSFTTQRDLPLTTVTAASPFVIRQPFGYDEASAWSGHPVDAAPIPMLTIGGIIKAKQWRWDNDAGETFWNVPPKSSAAIPMLTIGGVVKAKQWRWDNDDPSVWWDWVNRNSVVFTIPPNPFLPVFWRYYNDDPPPWLQPKRRSVALPFVPQVNSLPWRFYNDDPPPWQQPSQRSVGLPFVPAVVNRWRLDAPDDQLWSLTARGNVSIQSTPTQPAQSHQWLFGYDDASYWSGKPSGSAAIPALTAGGQPNTKLRRYENDDFSAWFPWDNRNLAIVTVKPFVAVFWKFNNDDAAVSWLPAVQRNPVLNSATIYNPNTLSQAMFGSTFAFDDASSWQWAGMRSLGGPIALRYVFEPSPRFASALYENRVISVSIESRVVAVPLESRVVSVTAANRVVPVVTANRVVPVSSEIVGGQAVAVTWPPKDPAEVADFDLDWTPQLAAPDTIQSSTWLITYTDAPTGTPIAIQSSTFIPTRTKVWVTGGNLGFTYSLQNTVVTLNGDTLVQTAKLPIKKK